MNFLAQAMQWRIMEPHFWRAVFGILCANVPRTLRSCTLELPLHSRVAIRPEVLFTQYISYFSNKHTQWYYGIRAKVWERISFEDQLPPSIEALELHWMRTLWVIDYWNQACQSSITLLPLEWFGWQVQDGVVSAEWDSPENIHEVRSRVAFLTHGCSCKMGCKSWRCKCVKAGQQCGPGCSCNHHSECQNRNTNSTTEGMILPLWVTLGIMHDQSTNQ